MSAFIVIGINERVEQIINGIIQNRPLNPAVNTIISYGIFKDNCRGIDNCEYQYVCFNGQTVEKCQINYERGFNVVFANQLAHLRAKCENKDSVINVFLVSNPLINDDFSRMKFILQELENLQDKNIRLMLTLLTFDLENIYDVTIRPKPNELFDFLDFFLGIIPSSIYRKDILYLNNKDLNHAAVCVDQMVFSRMLIDLYMLLSNELDAYRANASIGDHSIFSIGYSEWIFLSQDLDRYLKLTTPKDLLTKILNDPFEYIENLNFSNILEIIDIVSNPFSLIAKLNFVKPLFEKIEFITDPAKIIDWSIDGIRDKIISSFKSYIPPEKYIDRQTLYEYAKGNQSYMTNSERANFDGMVEKYNQLIEYINSDDFINTAELMIEQLNIQNTNGIQTEENQNKLNWWKKFLCWIGLYQTKNKVNTILTIYDNNSENVQGNESMLLREKWSEYKNTFLAETKYQDFINYIRLIENKLAELNIEIEKFSLSDGNKSNNLINKSKLKSFQNDISENHQKRIKSNWDKIRNQESFTIDSILEICNQFVDSLLSDYSFIDWKEFENDKQIYSFIEDLDIETFTNQLNKMQKQSVPFIAYQDFASESQLNKITKIVYNGNNDLKSLIESKDIKNIENNSLINSYCSDHIENKICMFQFLPIENVKNLYDCQ